MLHLGMWSSIIMSLVTTSSISWKRITTWSLSVGLFSNWRKETEWVRAPQNPSISKLRSCLLDNYTSKKTYIWHLVKNIHSIYIPHNMDIWYHGRCGVINPLTISPMGLPIPSLLVPSNKLALKEQLSVHAIQQKIARMYQVLDELDKLVIEARKSTHFVFN